MNTDSIQRFTFDALPIRGELVHVDTTWRQVIRFKQYPEPVARLLGEMLTAAALLASTIKVDGTLTLQTRGNGPVPLAMAEIGNRRGLRGIARTRPSRAIDDAAGEFLSLVGDGHLAMTIRPEKGEAYQGVVALAGDSLADCIETYFHDSEQIATRLWLSAADGSAAGLLLQRLPREGEEEEEEDEDWQRLMLLASTVSETELRELTNERLLRRLFVRERVRLHPHAPLEFRCSCSQGRTETALQIMGEREVRRVLAEEGDVKVICQFCGATYRFDSVDVDLLFRDTPPAPNGGITH